MCYFVFVSCFGGVGGEAGEGGMGEEGGGCGGGMRFG